MDKYVVSVMSTPDGFGKELESKEFTTCDVASAYYTSKIHQYTNYNGHSGTTIYLEKFTLCNNKYELLSKYTLGEEE